MQDIVVSLWQAYPRFDPQRRFSTWMYRICELPGSSVTTIVVEM